MNIIAIFAHYDKDNVIDDYVIYYLKALKEIAQKIIFVSDGNLSPEEISKLDGIVEKTICEKHCEYDFGSYKRGFLFAVENNLLNDIDECIFANDSCYGPFYPLYKVFDAMQEKDCDFWGITESRFGYRKRGLNLIRKRQLHIQSYFSVFKKNVFLSEVFNEFIRSIKEQENKSDIVIEYELGLSEKFLNAGFKMDSFIKGFENCFNSSVCFWDKLVLKEGMPFLKCSIPRLENMKYVTCDNYPDIIRKISNYPVDLILNNVRRTSKNKDYLFFMPKFIRPVVYKIIHFYSKTIKHCSA